MDAIKSFRTGKLQTYIFENRAKMGEYAAYDIAGMLKAMLACKPLVNVMFASAPSQNEMLAALALDEDVQWSRVNVFHMDEYIGLAADAPQGFGNFLKERIGKKKPHNEYYMDPTAPDPEEEVRRYAKLLSENPLDISILGIGENGHLAFNDPPVADFNDKQIVKVVELEEKCRLQQVHDGCFENLGQVPVRAITVTIPALLSSGAIFCIVPAASKAEAVANVHKGPISTACPASILREHKAKLYLDQDSAAKL